MPVSVSCPSCGAGLKIPDAVYERRVAGQVATLRCKRCKAEMEVDGRQSPPSVTVPAPASAPGPSEPEGAQPPASPVEEERAHQPPASSARSPSLIPGLDDNWSLRPPPLPTSPSPTDESAEPEHAEPEPPEPEPPEPELPEPEPPEPQRDGVKAVASDRTESAPHREKAKPPASNAKVAPLAQPGGSKTVVRTSPSSGKHLETYKKQPSPARSARKRALWRVSYDDESDEDRELDESQIRQELERGAIDRNTIVWRRGMDEWLPIAQVPALAALLPEQARAAREPQPRPAPPPEPRSNATARPASPPERARPDKAHRVVRAASGEVGSVKTGSVQENSAKAGQTTAGSSPGQTPRLMRPGVPEEIVTSVKPEVFLAKASRDLTAKPAPPPPALSKPTPQWSARLPEPALPPPPPPSAKSQEAAPPVAPRPLPAPQLTPEPEVPSASAGSAIVHPPTLPPNLKRRRAPVVAGVGALLLVAGIIAYALHARHDSAAPKDSPRASPAESSGERPMDTQLEQGGDPNAQPQTRPQPGASSPGSSAPNAGKPSSGSDFFKRFAAAVAKHGDGSSARQGGFDEKRAEQALAPVEHKARTCRQRGDPHGTAYITVTIDPSGKVTDAKVTGGPFAGKPTARCIEARLLRARIPPFSGSPAILKTAVKIR